MDILLNAYDLLNWVLGWPLIVAVIAVGVLCTYALGAVQLRYFFASWRYMFAPSEAVSDATCRDMSPLQAFINTLNANLGNGSVAGMATALYSGGPGAAFWVVVIGILLMSVRFTEVFLSTYFGAQEGCKAGLGGPMLYLHSVIGGRALSYIYAVSCFVFSLIVGNAIQSNTVRLSLQTTWGVPSLVTAVVLTLFMLYVVCGGAQRIAHISEKLVPIKVGIFFISSFLVLAYHYQALWAALVLIVKSALDPAALAGGTFGFTVQQAMRFGMSRSIMATESGLGTAAILYSSTGSRAPARDGIISMLSTFISTVVCFLITLSIIASGVWNSGLTSSALTIAAYETVFGQYGGWIVSFLSTSFGLGVAVTFAYITRETWLYITGGRWPIVVSILYCVVAFLGALASVNALWLLAESLNGLMLAMNLFGLVLLLPIARRGLRAFREQEKSAQASK